MELTYARWLAWCTGIALTVLVASFFAYLFQRSEPLIALETLPQVWELPVDRFREATGGPAGWGWGRFAARGDYANLAGVTLLALVPVACYLRILPLLLRQGERTLALLAAAQILVLLAAASGLLAGGH
ncbi:MAG: hypothetical protein A3G81_06025 [Betaproteobacteria bacterium RIFCSPLOWO2_12_FULL_65_14]|nr:MAG: hypothetical protein A3G81_06025 [Betaproteobacteria bacterium RIFCSPLOWO2_12_FULL_65_14]